MERHWSTGFVFLFLVPCHLKFNFRGISFLTFDPGLSLCFQAPLESCWESQTLCFAGHGFSMNVDMGGESASQQVQLDEIKCRMVELPHEEAEKATTVSGDEARVKVSKAALGRQLGQDEVSCFSEMSLFLEKGGTNIYFWTSLENSFIMLLGQFYLLKWGWNCDLKYLWEFLLTKSGVMDSA